LANRKYWKLFIILNPLKHKLIINIALLKSGEISQDFYNNTQTTNLLLHTNISITFILIVNLNLFRVLQKNGGYYSKNEINLNEKRKTTTLYYGLNRLNVKHLFFGGSLNTDATSQTDSDSYQECDNQWYYYCNYCGLWSAGRRFRI